MNDTKALFQSVLVVVLFAGCTDGGDRRELSPGHVNTSPQRVQLEIIDSLIRSGKHRKALTLFDSFQRMEKDEIFLIQSEALDSLYGE